MKKKFLLCGLVAMSILVFVFAAVPARSQTASATVTPQPTSSDAVPYFYTRATAEPGSLIDPNDRLAPPPMSDPPTQTELGHHAYWFSCMVCHGDRGQGLTDEWRNILDPQDRNCWQSKCHAPNHPPEGFEIPRYASPVIGPGTLGGFRTARDLFEYTRETMPWPYPGLRSDEEYWQLTAFLADANGIYWGGEAIGPDNAGQILMRSDLAQAPGPAIRLERLVALAVAGLLLSTLVLRRWTQAG